MVKGYKTEKESILTQIQNLYLLDRLLKRESLAFYEVADELPGLFHANYKKDLSILYINREGEKFTHFTTEEMREMGYEYFDKYTHPDTLKHVFPRFIEFYERANDDNMHVEFQQIQDLANGGYDTLFTVTKPYKEQDLLLTSSVSVKDLNWVSAKVERIFEEDIFVKKNFCLFQQLTNREIEVLSLIGSGFTNKVISEKLFLSIETIKQHRKMIKRKTECRNTVELVKFAQAFDLID